MGSATEAGPPGRAIYDSDPVQTSQIGSGRDGEGGPRVVVSVVVVGGLDPGGGAGLIRDLLTARGRGARAVAVGTAWTEQGEGIHRVEPRAGEAVRTALARALAAGPGAVKIGMVPDAAGAAAVETGLDGYRGPIVLDPVLRSSRAGALFRGDPADLLALARRATLVTPNAAEAEALTGRRVGSLDEAAAAGRALVDLGAAAVLVKGGHLGGAGEPATDTLVTAAGLRRFAHARVGGGDVRGTGCALATAIAVELARGRALDAALDAATAWLVDALGHAVRVGDERHLP
jgi:hydroxymethylpyrimidine/phosphomethylpyrimidine kinase